MKRGRGGGIGYAETQLMMPRFKAGDDSVTIQGGEDTGIVHAFWGYTYEIPCFIDTNNGDPGNSEIGIAYYWQVIIPRETVVDRVTWTRTDSISTNPGNLRFAWYDMNLSDQEFPRIAQTGVFDVGAATIGRHTMALEDGAMLIPAGLYAMAYVAPCFQHMLCFDENIAAESLSNKARPAPALLRYGAITVPLDAAGDLPDVLDGGNTLSYDDWIAIYSGFTPLTYWDDSQEFAAV